ncbi:hypothetical protein CBS101457_000311 [Exobasidium rhododendri]|nr:hypothetical protein CBS101457_000311 [Exobasidium rhododendri]
MVLRCFARRHLIPNRGLIQRQQLQQKALSTSTQTRQEQHESRGDAAVPARSGVNVQQTQRLEPGFFSSTSRISQAFISKSREGIFDGQKSSNSPKHPLVLDLYTELYDNETTSTPERVWTLYMAIHQASQEQLSSSSLLVDGSVDRLSLSLSARDHRHVLRSIAHKTDREQRKEASKDALFTYRYEGSQLQGAKLEGDDVSLYIQRVAFIFSQLRRSERPNLPGVKEYDQVLERLAPGGNMPALTALWAQMSGNVLGDFSSPSRRSNAAKAVAEMPLIAGIEPSAKTYVHLMLGISRHLADQIERAHRQFITSEMWRGQGKKKVRKQKESATAASKGTALFGQAVAPRARLAVQLASARCISLLRDMFERGVEPEKLTLDLALRMLRMDGNLSGIKLLIRGVYAIDLDNPDTDPRVTETSQRPVLTPDVHTLNTILMAFGEHGTVSEMISAYETISRPLPVKERNAGEASHLSTNLFSTDWRGIFAKDVAVVKEESDNVLDIDEPEVLPYRHPRAVVPNTTTMTVMIKHCNTAPNPARMVAVPLAEGSKRAQVIAKDHLARQNGDYVGVASYLLAEAVDWQEHEINRIAMQIGVLTPNIEEIQAKVVQWTQECQDAAALPAEMDKYEFVRKASEEGAVDMTEITLPQDFVPHFLPPALTVNYDMILPISSYASRRRTADFTLWKWIIAQTQCSIANKVAELQILHQGINHWEDVRSSADEFGAHLSKQALRSFIIALRKQKRMVRSEINLMGSHLIESLLMRFAALRFLRKEKKKQRNLKREGERRKVEEMWQVVERRKELAAKQKEEDKRRLTTAEEAELAADRAPQAILLQQDH